MNTATQTATRLVVLPQVNLLPPEIAEHKQMQRIQAGLALVVVVAIAAVGLLYIQGSSSVSDAKSHLAAAQVQQTALQAQQAKLAYVTAAKSNEDVANAALSQAMGTEIQWSHYLADLSRIVPTHVWFTSIQLTETTGPGTLANATAAPPTVGQITFSGKGLTHDDVAAWLDAAATEKGFTDPSFSQSTQSFIGSTGVVQFAATVDLTSAALSQRCAQPGSC